MKRLLLSALAGAAVLVGCNCSDTINIGCTTDAECGGANRCVASKCVLPDGGSLGGGAGGGTGGGSTVVTGCNPTAADNATRDTDCDGISDADEYSRDYGNGAHTDPCDSDTDGDGIKDGVETGSQGSVAASCQYTPDADPSSRTNPTVGDSDGDTLNDGAEDKNHDGRVDPGESNPTRIDSDCDGISDPDEVTGKFGCATDPLLKDSDGDGLPDGVEEGISAPGADQPTCMYAATVFDTEPATKTPACNPDADGDGIQDGAEDSNHNGKVDPGELDPNAPADGTGPAQAACATANLRPVTFQSAGLPDVQVALVPGFTEVGRLTDGAGEQGLIFYDSTSKVAGLVLSKMPAGADGNAEEAFGRGKLGSAGTLSAAITQTFTTWDGFGTSVRGTYDYAGNVDLKTRLNDVAKAYLGMNVAGTLAGLAGVSGPFKVQAEFVHRTNNRAVVLIAIVPISSYTGQAIFSLDDVGGGSALAQFGDFTGVQCEVFDATINAKVDFLWVVDDSNSMAQSQNAVGNAGTVFSNKLASAGLDWRVGAVTTGYYANSAAKRDFTSTIATMQSWFLNGGANWFGVSGSGTEEPFSSSSGYMNTLLPRTAAPSPTKFRDGASVQLIVLSDTDDQSPMTPASYTAYYQALAGGAATVHGLVCPEGTRCSNQEGTIPATGRTQTVIRGTGGVIGDMSLANTNTAAAQAQLAATIDAILSAAIAGTGHQLQKPPISATIKVAIETGGTKGTCNTADVPRSRTDGFDFDSATRKVVFFGACIPNMTGRKVAVSYRYWIDNSPDPGGDPCGAICTAPKICDPGTKTCVCPTNCGNICTAATPICDMNACACTGGVN